MLGLPFIAKGDPLYEWYTWTGRKEQTFIKARHSVLQYFDFVDFFLHHFDNILTVKLSQKSTQSYIKFFADKLRQVLILYWHYWNTLTKTEVFFIVRTDKFRQLLISSDGTEKLWRSMTILMNIQINLDKYWRLCCTHW